MPARDETQASAPPPSSRLLSAEGSLSIRQIMEATLWPRGAHGALSHETALDLYGLSDVNPAKIHITVPHGVCTIGLAR